MEFCRVDEEEDGEKAAIVGGSAEVEVEVEADVEGSPSLVAGGFVIEVIQGVSSGILSAQGSPPASKDH